MRFFWSAVLVSTVAGCGGSNDSLSARDRERAREESCAVPAPTACPDPAPTYAEVRPLFDEDCAECHTVQDPDGPWPLEDYSHIVAWRSEVRDEVLTCNMPPEDGDPLSPDDRLLLMEWIFCGMPE